MKCTLNLEYNIVYTIWVKEIYVSNNEMSMLTSYFNGDINCKQFESVQLCFCHACIVCWVWNETYFSKPVKWMMIYLKQVLEQKSWGKSKHKKHNPIKFFIAFSIFKTITVITVFLQEYIIRWSSAIFSDRKVCNFV